MPNEKDIEGTIYHIRVKGNLDPRWADWFEGFILGSGGNGETLLRGKVRDQAALYGLLGKLQSLGLPLVLVAQIDHPYNGVYCRLCSQSTDLSEESQTGKSRKANKP
ncbi:MAG TPA: hypothetical protein VK249_09670 [Anaerolineales bacterium]|nr:hypothetical protein [Anaerolineales bacterium]